MNKIIIFLNCAVTVALKLIRQKDKLKLLSIARNLMGGGGPGGYSFLATIQYEFSFSTVDSAIRQMLDIHIGIM